MASEQETHHPIGTSTEKSTAIADTLFRTITFSIGEQLYAIDILYIRDIVLGKKIYRIPNSDPILIGVTNIRGEILPVFSLKAILGSEDKLNDRSIAPTIVEPEEDEYLIVLKLENHLFAIAIDQINKNISVTKENYNDGSYMSKWAEDTIFIGVIVDEEDNILLIDAPTLIHSLTARISSLSF